MDMIGFMYLKELLHRLQKTEKATCRKCDIIEKLLSSKKMEASASEVICLWPLFHTEHI
jgi:hypothetical protein